MQQMILEGGQFMTATDERPVVIIGAGPVGLAAAAHLCERQLPFVIVERGVQVGASVRAWSHIQLFSPWQYCVDAAAVRLLTATGWVAPVANTYPTGADLVTHYLEPLAQIPAIANALRLGVTVTQVTRQGMSKSDTQNRAMQPFAVHMRDAKGHEQVILASAVIDASGTLLQPNPLGAAGVPAVGEQQATAALYYGIPDVLGDQRGRYAGKRVAVAGSGHSAFHVLLDLVELQRHNPATQIWWVVRRRADQLQIKYGGGAADALPARGSLGQRVQAAVQSSAITVVPAWRTDQVIQTDHGVVLGAGDQRLPAVDHVVVVTGFRPDSAMLRELRLSVDEIVEAPRALAPHIDPNLHSCGTVPPHGVRELSHPEPGVFVVGMKSYGRAPTFLLMTGYEQVRSVVAALAGDWQAALDVQLVLPETGVCSGPADATCCAPNAIALIDACCAPANTIALDMALVGDAPPQRCC
ncbi:MAG: NAD(P)-binding domain-containing protein [Roseiflexaceae bacterium]